MNKIKYFYILLIPLIIIIISISSCSKIEDNLVTASKIGTHPSGWTTPANSSFHGKYISANGWTLKPCKQCHGADYSGGNTGASCNNCHSATPEDCRLCHGDGVTTIFPPKALNGSTDPSYIGVGAHNVHSNSDPTVRNSLQVACINCHKQPTSFDDTVHINPNRPFGIAYILFDSLAIHSGKTPPVWNRTNATCANTYCHGNFEGGNNATPVWTDASSVKCGSCHGDGNNEPCPTTNHVQGFPITTCGISPCHFSVMNTNGTFKNKDKHINGVVNFSN